MIGSRRITEIIAVGDMGGVCLAEQGEPSRRRVAPKVICPGVAGDQIVVRFEAERQALALIKNP